MKAGSSSNTEVLKHLEFELAYLSLLTAEGIKPLSRWEKPFDSATQGSLGKFGLKTCVVDRTIQAGRTVRELLLSNSDESLEAYAQRFAGLPITHDQEAVRMEGRLFGYPACCVESFAAHGYLKNSLHRRDQRILFHWACPECAVTPQLVPDYRRIYRMCLVARRGRVRRSLPDLLDKLKAPRLGPRVAAAVSLATLGMLPTTTLPVTADPLDPHVIAFTLYEDPDLDFLITSEEMILGLNPALGDQNTSSVPDGVDLALQLSAAVDALPSEPSSTNVFVRHNLAFGLENCAVCGAAVNMGFLEVCHPLENQSIEVPYVAKHFLEHGSFSYSGSIHSGRVNPPLLSFILHSDGRGHFISEPAGTDVDNDGLRNWEEPAFGTDPANPDTDSDHLVDSIDVARELRQELEALPAVGRREDGPTDRPFVVMLSMNGIETCPRCGEIQTMGFWEVINPVTGDSLTIPTMGIHYLEHGAFAWSGGQLLGGHGRVDPSQLQGILRSQPNRHLLSVTPDKDSDWLSDQEEVSLGKDAANPDQDGNAAKDGLDLARVVACEIAGLPTNPSSYQVYRIDLAEFGLERCDICGTNANMGHLTICNPQAHLSVNLPYIALHYLEHDSFSFAGDVHGSGRSEVKKLLDALFKPTVGVTAAEQDINLRWIAKAGRTYQVDTALDPGGPWTHGPVFRGDDKEVVFTDAKLPGASKCFYKISVW